MTTMTGRILRWAPRVLAIAFAVFVSLFSLDVFQEGYRGSHLLMALSMHLVTTTGVVVAALLLAWWWPLLGALVFAAAGTYYASGHTRHPDWVLVISGPLLLTALLFLADALVRRRRAA
ncbi:MAG TPA: hypothetical protein VLV15_14990 [Dongiaceae bacterium]|nr:hypothetical protein [Dongiaceae bacterium]